MKEWLHGRGIYVDYTYDLNWKELKLFSQYPFFFDDDYWYWQPPKNLRIMKRAPLWMYPQKTVAAEKHKKQRDSRLLFEK